MAGPQEFGNGTFNRITKQVYWFVALTMCTLVALAPSFVGSLLLAREASNIPLYGLLAWLCAPGLSAALYTCARKDVDLDEGPFAAYWQGIVRNWKGALVLALPAVALGTIVAFNAAWSAASGVSPVFVWIGLFFGVIALIWCTHALTIHSEFNFRLQDLLRLGFFYVGGIPRATLGALSLWVLTIGIIYFTFDAIAYLGAGLLAFLFWRNGRSVTAHVRENFIAPAAEPAAE